MRLVVETGKGLPDANSYIDLTDVEKYLTSNVLAEWDELSEDEQIDRLIIASLFIDFSFKWIGQQKTLEQGLSWPRVNVFFQGHKVPDDYIPKQIKRAVVMVISLIMEFGLGVLQETNEVQVKKEKIGPFETEYFEALNIEFANSSQYTDINNMLRGFFVRTGGVLTAGVLRR
jgi:hypothetical protein